MFQPDKFWNRMAKGYSKQPIKDEDAYQKKLAVTREYFRPEMELLEFGCGTGGTAINHAPHVNHILAIDVSSTMLEIAQAKADEANVENVTFKQASIDDFSAPEESFDMVLGLSILHLVKNKAEIIAKVHKLLKPDGIFVTSTVCLGDTMKYFKFITPFTRLLGLNLKVFSEQELVESIAGAGFEIDHQWRPSKDAAVFLVAKKIG